MEIIENADLAKDSSKYQEGVVITIPMGSGTCQIFIKNGIIYAKLSPIMKLLGYEVGYCKQQAERLGLQYFKKIKVGKQDCWFINIDGFDELLRTTKRVVSNAVMSIIYRDVYGIAPKEKETPFSYKFTDGEMLDIIHELNRKPVHKDSVISLLFKGKR
jgi:hypothetical protein